MRRILTSFLILLFPMTVWAVAAPWTYRGFDVRELGQRLDEALKDALSDQIDIVLSVGCSPSTTDFFRSVPLLVVPANGVLHGTPGLYIRGDRAIKITSRIVAVGHKPVFLHELLHAYHDQKLSGGFLNRTVVELYREAKGEDLFVVRSHMMQNPSEFFACAGTTFLFGVTAQEPFKRSSLAKQPNLVKLLEEAFGPSCGGYEGSLGAKRPDQ
jgi:hypothetical protein